MATCPNKCLICSVEGFEGEYQEGGHNSEILEDENFSQVFQVLCQYMNWSIEDDLQLDFTSDPFPFCGQCLPPLLRLHHLHQDIQDLLTETRKITVNMTKVILDTFDVNRVNVPAGSSRGQLSEDDQASHVGETNRGLADKLHRYQLATYQQYRPVINITEKAGRDSMRILKPPNSTVPDNIFILKSYSLAEDSDDDDADFAVCSDGSWSGDDMKEAPSTSANSKTCRNKKPNNSGRKTRLSNASAGDPSLTVDCNDPGGNVSSNTLQSTDTDQHPMEVNGFVPDKLHYFASTKLAGNVEQIGESTFRVFKKRLFQLVDNHEWKCLQCNYTTLYKQHLFVHLQCNKLNNCVGVKPADSVKEFKHRRVFYDQLKDLRLECRLCDKNTNNHEEMKTHIENSHQSRNTKIGNIKQLMDMFIRTQDDGSFHCETCDEHFDRKKTARAHLRNKHQKSHDGPIKTRQITKKIGLNKYSVADKFTFDFKDGEYQCCECSHVSRTFVTMQHHMNLIHLKTAEYVCEHCGRSFNNRGAMLLHRMRIHSGPPSIPCDVCGKSFTSQFLLRLHKRETHVERTFMCDTCGMAFTTNHRLICHRRTHENATCEICGKVTTVSFLRHHMKTHAMEFQCDRCQKMFAFKNGLHVHQMSCGRKAEKKFSCDVCGLKFVHNHSMVRHRKTCDGTKVIPPKPFPCDLCDAHFAGKRSVYRHRKEIHGIKPRPKRPSRKNLPNKDEQLDEDVHMDGDDDFVVEVDPLSI